MVCSDIVVSNHKDENKAEGRPKAHRSTPQQATCFRMAQQDHNERFSERWDTVVVPELRNWCSHAQIKIVM